MPFAPAFARLSSWSAVELDRIRPQRPKSTRALLCASAALASSTPPASTAGTVFGMSITVVTPPAAAAAVSVPKSSFSGKPGSRLWTWTSMAPGSTYIPRASTTPAPGEADLRSAKIVMTPSEMWTSTRRGPSGVWTVPPAMTRAGPAARSIKFQVRDAEKRRIRNAGAADVLLSPFAPGEHDDEVDPLHARVAEPPGRAQGSATRGHDG